VLEYTQHTVLMGLVIGFTVVMCSVWPAGSDVQVVHCVRCKCVMCKFNSFYILRCMQYK